MKNAAEFMDFSVMESLKMGRTAEKAKTSGDIQRELAIIPPLVCHTF
jgi:hypothetical protein